jgi:hypothetical protein
VARFRNDAANLASELRISSAGFTYGTQISFCGWFFFNQTRNPSDFANFYSHNDGSNGFYFAMEYSTRTARYQPLGRVGYYGGPLVPQGRWFHLGFTILNGHGSQIWFDARPVATGYMDGPSNPSGTANADAAYMLYSRGCIGVEDVWVINRAIGASEMRALMAGQGRQVIKAADIITHLPFEGTPQDAKVRNDRSKTLSLGRTIPVLGPNADLKFNQLASALGGTAYTSTLTESVTCTDSIIKQARKVWLETATCSDSAIKQGRKTLAESATPNDSILKQARKRLSDSSTCTDSILKQGRKALADTATATDSVLKRTTTTKSETATATDSILKRAGKLLGESITASDSLIKRSGKVCLEVATATDSLIKATYRTLTDTTTITDTLLSVKTFLKTLSESIAVSDTLIRSTQKVITESLTATDTAIKSVSKFLSDAATISDSIVKSTLKTLSDSVAASDSLIRSTQKLLVDAASAIDSLIKSTSRIFTETVSATALLVTSILTSTVYAPLTTIYANARKSLVGSFKGMIRGNKKK